MALAIEMERKKPKKQRQQVKNFWYLAMHNVIDLSFDEGLGVGCRSKSHVN